MFSWFWNLLSALGLWQKKATIVVCGLDNAGKTTLLHKLKSGKISTFLPTQRPNVDEVSIANVRFSAWDLGGHSAVRDLWSEYLVAADAVVFMLDSADASRFAEARAELHKLIGDVTASKARTPIAILANKTDLSLSASRSRLLAELGIPEHLIRSHAAADDDDAAAEEGDESRASAATAPPPLELFRCSLIIGVGYVEAFEWISSFV